MKRIVLALCCAVQLAHAATTYYASPSGSSGNSGLSSSAPWPIDYAVANAGVSNTIILLDGNYTVSGSMTPAVGQTIKAQNKWGAKFNDHTGNLFTIPQGTFSHYVTFDGLSFSNCQYYAIYNYCLGITNLTIRNCWFQHTGKTFASSQGASGVQSYAGVGLLIENCLCEWNGTNNVGGFNHGIYAGGTNAVIRNNVCRYNDGYGISIDTHSTAYAPGGAYSDIGVRVYNNLVYGNFNPETDKNQVQIYDDTIASPPTGFTNYIYGNTIISPGNSAIALKGADVEITNNILVSTSGGITAYIGGQIVHRDYNLAPQALTFSGAHDVTSSSYGFVNSGHGLYWLTAGSAARAKALSSGAGAVDFFGNTQTSVSDIGAFQYSSALASDTRTLDPSGTNPNYWSTSGSSPNIYVSQTAQGGDTGVDAANAHSIAWLNNGANWGTGASQVGPGTTVHLVGTFVGVAGTTMITPPAGGAAGNPVTILFEPGCVFTSPQWAVNGAIYINGQSYIDVDGGVGGVITNTDNGTGLGHSVANTGVNLLNASYINVRNLTISCYKNLGANSGATDVNGDGSYDIAMDGNYSHVRIYNNRVFDAKAGIQSTYFTADTIEIDHNYSASHCWGIVVGGIHGQSSVATNVKIHDNEITDWDNWGYPGSTYHQDGIIMWTSAGHTFTPEIYNNYLHGNLAGGSVTAFIFVTYDGVESPAGTMTPLIHDNIIAPLNYATAIWTQNHVVNARVYNNTVVGVPGTSQYGILQQNPNAQTYIQNNIFKGVVVAIGSYYANSGSVAASDNNEFYSCNAIGSDNFLSGAGPVYSTMASWRAAYPAFDAHSLTTNPNLDGSYKLQAGSPAIGAGANLSAYFTTDAAGNSYPAVGAWDIGAYQYQNIGNTAPTINTQPQSQTVSVGQSASFSVVASGSSPLVYQWTHATTNLPTATQASLTIASAQTSDAGNYTVIVTNNYGAVTSSIVSLTVNATPSRTLSTNALPFGYVIVGQTPTMSVWVTNTGLGTLTGIATASAPYSIGAGGGSYSLTAGQAQQINVNYSPVVKAFSSGSITFSDNVGTAVVTATGYAYPMLGNSFNGTDGLVLAPFNSSGTCIYENSVDSTYGIAVYGFTIASTGDYVFNTTVQAQDQGQNSFLVNIDADPVSPANIWDIQPLTTGTQTRQISWRGTGTDLANQFVPKVFTLTAGTHFMVLFGRENQTVLCSVSIVPNVVGQAPTITSQPLSASINIGGTTNLAVSASGTAPLAYQWYKLTSAIAGATTNTLGFTNIQTSSAGNYTVVVTNSFGAVTSSVATVTVNCVPAAITVQPASLNVTVGQQATFTVTAVGSAPLAYQWKKGGSNISGATDFFYIISSPQLTDAGNYTVEVSNSCGDVTSSAATLNVANTGSAPHIAINPSDFTINVGQQATMGVLADSGTSPIVFQWKKDGVNIPGATATSYTIYSAQLTDSGHYNVTITNAYGYAISSTNTATINGPPPTAIILIGSGQLGKGSW